MLSAVASPDRYVLRVIIQRIGEEAEFIWRVVAYGGRKALGPADFPSRETLLDVLPMAFPDFDQAGLSLADPGPANSSILFAGEMELDDEQLSVLGLSGERGSPLS